MGFVGHAACANRFPLEAASAAAAAPRTVLREILILDFMHVSNRVKV
jgi:hypothetical protein